MPSLQSALHRWLTLQCLDGCHKGAEVVVTTKWVLDPSEGRTQLQHSVLACGMQQQSAQVLQRTAVGMHCIVASGRCGVGGPPSHTHPPAPQGSLGATVPVGNHTHCDGSESHDVPNIQLHDSRGTHP